MGHPSRLASEQMLLIHSHTTGGSTHPLSLVVIDRSGSQLLLLLSQPMRETPETAEALVHFVKLTVGFCSIGFFIFFYLFSQHFKNCILNQSYKVAFLVAIRSVKHVSERCPVLSPSWSCTFTGTRWCNSA